MSRTYTLSPGLNGNNIGQSFDSEWIEKPAPIKKRRQTSDICDSRNKKQCLPKEQSLPVTKQDTSATTTKSNVILCQDVNPKDPRTRSSAKTITHNGRQLIKYSDYLKENRPSETAAEVCGGEHISNSKKMTDSSTTIVKGITKLLPETNASVESNKCSRRKSTESEAKRNYSYDPDYFPSKKIIISPIRDPPMSMNARQGATTTRDSTKNDSIPEVGNIDHRPPKPRSRDSTGHTAKGTGKENNTIISPIRGTPTYTPASDSTTTDSNICDSVTGVRNIEHRPPKPPSRPSSGNAVQDTGKESYIEMAQNSHTENVPNLKISDALRDSVMRGPLLRKEDSFGNTAKGTGKENNTIIPPTRRSSTFTHASDTTTKDSNRSDSITGVEKIEHRPPKPRSRAFSGNTVQDTGKESNIGMTQNNHTENVPNLKISDALRDSVMRGPLLRKEDSFGNTAKGTGKENNTIIPPTRRSSTFTHASDTTTRDSNRIDSITGVEKTEHRPPKPHSRAFSGNTTQDAGKDSNIGMVQNNRMENVAHFKISDALRDSVVKEVALRKDNLIKSKLKHCDDYVVTNITDTFERCAPLNIDEHQVCSASKFIQGPVTVVALSQTVKTYKAKTAKQIIQNVQARPTMPDSEVITELAVELVFMKTLQNLLVDAKSTLRAIEVPKTYETADITTLNSCYARRIYMHIGKFHEVCEKLDPELDVNIFIKALTASIELKDPNMDRRERLADLLHVLTTDAPDIKTPGKFIIKLRQHLEQTLNSRSSPSSKRSRSATQTLTPSSTSKRSRLAKEISGLPSTSKRSRLAKEISGASSTSKDSRASIEPPGTPSGSEHSSASVETAAMSSSSKHSRPSVGTAKPSVDKRRSSSSACAETSSNLHSRPSNETSGPSSSSKHSQPSVQKAGTSSSSKQSRPPVETAESSADKRRSSSSACAGPPNIQKVVLLPEKTPKPLNDQKIIPVPEKVPKIHIRAKPFVELARSGKESFDARPAIVTSEPFRELRRTYSMDRGRGQNQVATNFTLQPSSQIVHHHPVPFQPSTTAYPINRQSSQRAHTIASFAVSSRLLSSTQIDQLNQQIDICNRLNIRIHMYLSNRLQGSAVDNVSEISVSSCNHNPQNQESLCHLIKTGVTVPPKLPPPEYSRPCVPSVLQKSNVTTVGVTQNTPMGGALQILPTTLNDNTLSAALTRLFDFVNSSSKTSQLPTNTVSPPFIEKSSVVPPELLSAAGLECTAASANERYVKPTTVHSNLRLDQRTNDEYIDVENYFQSRSEVNAKTDAPRIALRRNSAVEVDTIIRNDPTPRTVSTDSGMRGPIENELTEHIFGNRDCRCGKRANYLCSCNAVMYCSRECQHADWPVHCRTAKHSHYRNY